MARRITLLKVLLFVACLGPLVWVVARALGVGGSSLGANPVEELLNTFGKSGLNLLMLTLCVTPIRRSTGLNRLVAFRRMLGLFAFFYIVLHFLTYSLLDLGLAWDTLLVDIAERPYITVGFTALVLMVPLAITSTNGFQRRLGRRWVKLHRLVYVIAVLGVVHYWWQVKIDIGDPLLYAVLLAVLLGVRVAHWRSIQRKRERSVDSKTAMAPTYQRVEPP
jgi:sulfoxide reductase heme-binding subunit YedZ